MNNGGPGHGAGNGHNNVKPDIFGDQVAGSPLSMAEEALFRAIYAEEDMERAYEEHVEAAHRKMWMHFQAAASSLTHLYRERDGVRRSAGASNRECDNEDGGHASNSLWGPFQAAAGNLTNLYRESWENLLRTGGQVAKKSGHQKARKELLTWARSRRRCIRREELLSFLSSMGPHGVESRPTQISHVQPLLGVEELLQAASVTENQDQDQGAAAAAVVSIARSLKRPMPTPSPPTTVTGVATGGRKTPSPNQDVTMSEHYSPVFKRPRQL